MKKALITGITGQDGSYLAELLISKGYDVHGIIRRNSSDHNTDRIDALLDKITIWSRDVSDPSGIVSVIEQVKPDEIYNLAAQSHVQHSFEQPYYTAQVNAIGVLNILEAVRVFSPTSKVYQASTSELFGKVIETPQKETTPFYPRSPYGVAKLYAYWLIKNYREAYNLFACNGILFNHESPRRGPEFLTKKITLAVGDYKSGYKDCVSVGNLDAKRDWGHAKDYVYGMWLMLQQDKPDDFILATGETHSVREFIERAFHYVGINITWVGSGLDEVGIDDAGKTVVKVDPKFFRPTEVDLLLGDPSKAEKELKWSRLYSFDDLIAEMVSHDVM